MSVERRFSVRQPVDFRVDIRYRKRRLHSAHARNLSPDGMYLDIQSITLPTGTLVELELNGRDGNRMVPAVVVHNHGSGIGIMFREPQPDLFRDLSELNRKPCPEAKSRFPATMQAHPASAAG